MIIDKYYEFFHHNIIKINNILTVIHKMHVCTITINDTINKFTYLHECFDFSLTFWSILVKIDSTKLFSTNFYVDKIDFGPCVFRKIVVDPLHGTHCFRQLMN